MFECRHADGGSNVMFIITKSSNGNTVIYKGVGGEAGIEVFWMLFDKPGDDGLRQPSLNY